MKVIRIKKSYRNGNKILHIIVSDTASNDAIEEMVEDECDKGVEGMNYGYSAEWEVETDEDIITEVITNKLRIVNRRIESLETDKEYLTDLLNNQMIKKLNK